MKFQSCLIITILSIFGIAFLAPTRVFADSVTPPIYEISLAKETSGKGKATFTNEGSEAVLITPRVSAYDPKTLQLISDEKSLFLVLDRETYTVEPKGSLILDYDINPPVNLSTGSYFNLIIFQKSADYSNVNESNQLGTVENLSQLVGIHILETQTTYPLQIQKDFAQITMEITDAGIPFLKPMSIKYTYQNTTNYVLQPIGEIQAFDAKSSYSPEYIQINATSKKLYPGDSIEETLTIKKWHLSDILFGRKIVGRFYNGIDQNSIIKEQAQNTYFTYLAIAAGALVLTFVLIKSIQADKKRKTT